MNAREKGVRDEYLNIRSLELAAPSGGSKVVCEVPSSEEGVTITAHDAGQGISVSMVVPFERFQLWASTVLGEINVRLREEEDTD